ncbi:MAG TPA: glycoside hydrolase family 16 protein [Humisphaera sp.]
MHRPLLLVVVLLLVARPAPAADAPKPGDPLPPPPAGAKLVLEEDWSAGRIDPARWYVPRAKWGAGNHGVVPENVAVARESVDGKDRFVLTCTARGDRYDGPVTGFEGKRDRVGGIVVSKAFFASGRFQVAMRVGGGDGGPRRPTGTVPAIWTYAYRFVQVPKPRMWEFVPGVPLYNPHMPRYGTGANEYWSELDFPELGKAGRFDRPMYNAFLQKDVDSRTFDLPDLADGLYHTYTTDWRTHFVGLDGLTDAQVTESEGFFWVKDKAVPFDRYYGNPLKRLGPDRYAVHAGLRADHYVDGKKVAENTKFVPSMAAQLTMGVWLPDWAGPADWRSATVSFADVRVWQFGDEGDVRGILTADVPDNFEPDGTPVKRQ